MYVIKGGIYLKKLLVYLKDYIRESILGPLFKLLEALFELFVPLVIAAIIDTGIENGDTGPNDQRHESGAERHEPGAPPAAPLPLCGFRRNDNGVHHRRSLRNDICLCHYCAAYRGIRHNARLHSPVQEGTAEA